MERIVSATEARIHFGELMRRAVDSNQPIVIERGGKSHVVLLSMAEYERLLETQPRDGWRELVRRAQAQIRAELGERELPPPEEILRQVREERDAQLDALY